MKKWILLSLLTLSLPIAINQKDDFKKYSVGARIKNMNSGLLQAQKAFAATVLDPATMNLSTVGGRADFIRFLYFVTVGTPADYSIPNGPQGGLVGVVKQVMGSQGMGGALYNMGYTECSAIPASGSETITEGADTYTITFATPSKTIPSHYGAHAGGSFAKSVKIALNSVDMLKTEFNCESNGLTSGYVRMNIAEESRNMEVYFLRDSTNKDGYLDFYMTYAGSSYSEKAAVQFKTLDDNTYDLFLFRNQDNTSGNDEGAAFGLKGDATTGLVQAHYIFDSNDATLDNSTAIGSGMNECIDLSTNGAGTGCSAIETPNNVTLGAAFSWTIQSLANLSLSAF